MIDKALMGIRKVIGNIKKGYTNLIYGPAGIGKTTLLDTLNDDTLIINLDCGERVLSGEHIEVFDLIKGDERGKTRDINKIERFEKICNWLLDQPTLPWKYIALDNVTELQDAYLECLQSQRGRKYPSQLEYRDTGIEVKRWLKRLRNLTYKGVNVIYIAWEDTAKVEDHGGSVMSEKLPMIMGKSCKHIMGLVDYVGAMRTSQKGTRFLQFDSDSKYYAKKREEPGKVYTFKEGMYWLCPEGEKDTLQRFYKMIEEVDNGESNLQNSESEQGAGGVDKSEGGIGGQVQDGGSGG